MPVFLSKVVYNVSDESGRKEVSVTCEFRKVFFFFFFSLNDNFIEPWNYTRSTEDLRHVVRWHYIQRDPSYYNI